MTRIGVDVAKNAYEACAHGAARTECFKGAGALEKLLEMIERQPEPHVILEASGRYEQPLCEALAQRAIAFTVVNPARARAFMRSVGAVAKTDAIRLRESASCSSASWPSLSATSSS